ncbi:MAG: hypothetical protein OS112_07060 [Methanoregula sp.]|nr:MAG: hypothetical protein OS112_07060 [Methanoregula sp.]
MKPQTIVLSIFLFLICVGTVSGATSVISATSPEDAVALVYISGYDLDPQVFYPYEKGVVTVHVYNAANASVGLSPPNLIDPNVNVINKNSFNTMTNIGPGATVDFSFLVTVDPPDGTYFPLFTVPTKTANSVHSTLKIVVDSTDIRASISKKPDTFSLLKKDTVNVSIINPRKGDITNVLVIPEGTGIDVTPSEYFVGTLKAGSSVQVPFQVTPVQQSNLTFHISFRNGDNKHTTDVTLPILLGEDKLAVVPVVNNVALTSSGSAYTVSGDISNAGLTDAKSMVVTIGAPARAVEPYSEYAIGSLASDDFSSFELSFTGNDLLAVPLVITWKDKDGNSFSTKKILDLRSGSAGTSPGISTGTGISGSGTIGSSGTATVTSGSPSSRTAGGAPGGGSIFGFGGSRGGGISSFYPVIAGGIILVVGIVLYKKRKWIAAKIPKIKKP